MKNPILRRIDPSAAGRLVRQAIQPEILAEAASIVEDVRARGVDAVIQHATRLGDLDPGDQWLIKPKDLHNAWRSLPLEQHDLLKRCADRVRVFAEKQKECLTELEHTIPGGRVGHTVRPVHTVGCYVPGGRFPLPSSVLMTIVTARVAGVETVWAASPRPSPITMAAGWLAGADGLLAIGGAQAIAALSFGMDPIPACDMLAGPGNAWVTAAKQIVSRHTAIDMLAGPSELLIIADASADPKLVAMDLLAQAEHDPMALPMLISTSEQLIELVEHELVLQLDSLPDSEVARTALANGFCVLVSSLEQATRLSDRLAPEHLQLLTENPKTLAPSLCNYGALFVGSASAEVLGDYAAGPNHVLPTGGSASHMGGLSVLNFLKVRTWLRIDDPKQARQLYSDAAHLARLEGLEAHAQAARSRIE